MSSSTQGVAVHAHSACVARTSTLSNYSTTAAMNGSIALANNATLATVAASPQAKTPPSRGCRPPGRHRGRAAGLQDGPGPGRVSAADEDTARASSIAAALLSYYTIAQVDGLLAGKLGVMEAASALQIAARVLPVLEVN